MSKQKLFPKPAKWPPPYIWNFVLENEKGEYVWAFPCSWENASMKKPYHYNTFCSIHDFADSSFYCKHSPPEKYIKLWETLNNLKIRL